jgi:3-isopropylmalate dehydrogenase
VRAAVGLDAEYVHADLGWERWTNEGNALPERTIELLAKHKLGLFGAITSKPTKEADAELRADLRGKGLNYFSPIVGMRQALQPRHLPAAVRRICRQSAELHP